jgi:UDP-N-acetylmuramoyl-L-alanyl-D-glutamate--2,6-diaminopimelate ligase
MDSGCNLKAALGSVDVLEIRSELPAQVSGITQDSRRVQAGYVFAARYGEKVNGLDFAGDARVRGAAVILTDSTLPGELPLPVVRVRNFRAALAQLSQAIYRDPSRRLKLIGITGTNGKTTTGHLVKSVVEVSGARCGLIGTVGYNTGARKMDAPLTTPDIDRLSELLAEMADAGCEYAVMEVSSHALAQERVAGLRFVGAGFTNLSRDHLDYHNTFEEYAAAKARLFEMMEPDGVAVVNARDPFGEYMASAARGEVVWFSSVGAADLNLYMVQHDVNGGRYRLTICRDCRLAERMRRQNRQQIQQISGGWVNEFEVITPLVGIYHGENIALAAGLTLGLGFSIADVQRGVDALKCVPGRMEAVKRGQPFAVLVDYSHTPDALEQALKSLRLICQGRLLVVFGCGGDRDHVKRPQMGKIAAELADCVIVTSDNPRFEQPEEIMKEIMDGVPAGERGKVTAEVDRQAAIGKALETARDGDVVLIAGKGHETYQETAGVRRPFDDRVAAGEALAGMGGGDG